MARFLPLVVLLFLCQCGRERFATPLTTPAAAVAPVAVALPLPLEPVDGAGASAGGAVALARLRTQSLAFLADTDDGAVVTFDLDARLPLATTHLGGRPSAVLVTPAGRIVALEADDARAHILVMTRVDRPLVAERTVAVPDEPVSATLMPSGQAVLVASRWGHALTIVPLSGDTPPVVVDLPRDPTAAVASSDGHRAFVVHAVGSRASVVDLDARTSRVVSLDRQIRDPSSMLGWLKKVSVPEFDGDPMFLGGIDEAQGSAVEKPRRAVRTDSGMITLHADQAFAAVRVKDAIVAPLVSVDPGADSRTFGYGGRSAPVTASVASFDESGLAPPVGRGVFGHCLLPRGAAVDSVRGKVFVACLGSDQVSVLDVSTHGIHAEQDVHVPGGPAAVSIDPVARRAVVWSAFSREVAVLAIDPAPTMLAQVALDGTASPLPDAAIRGRVLFNTNFDSRIASDGRACASCHLDARDDGLAWSSPGGRRQTPMLVERLEGTAPYGWDGSAADFAHHLGRTTARLGGSGLNEGEAADLFAYIGTLHVPASRGDAALVARGRVLFGSEETGCAGCHAGGALTDGDTHDVRSKAGADADHAFDTPSLHLIAHSAPYFHDGRYATLDDLLVRSDGAMGHTSQLSPRDRIALEAYLQQL
jgi:DNA-binding beta-propeller fold protein YncE/mono/diheme cytochrome c family protein